MREPSDRIQSVSRALRVLEEVGAHPDGVNAKRVASRCGLALSTTYHLLRTLAWEGYLRRLPSGDYAVGEALADRHRDLLAARAERPGAAGPDVGARSRHADTADTPEPPVTEHP